jgi:hypothetical protein
MRLSLPMTKMPGRKAQSLYAVWRGLGRRIAVVSVTPAALHFQNGARQHFRGEPESIRVDD